MKDRYWKFELPSSELYVTQSISYDNQPILKFGEYLNDMQCDDTDNKLYISDLNYVSRLEEGIKSIIYQIEHNPRPSAENRDKYIIKQLNDLLNGGKNENISSL